MLGRYRFKRMPYGTHSASEIFQLEISKIIFWSEGCANSQDDIIVWQNSIQQHDERLKAVFDHIRQSGVKLNTAKCVFGVNELTSLGHVVSAHGVKPDPKKVEAITEYPMPKNKTELQRFLGTITYLGKFTPKLS